VAGLADRLSKSVAAVYTSPLRRAAETAERIAGALGLPIVPERYPRDAPGRWEGMTVAEIQAAFPGTYERWLADPQAILRRRGSAWRFLPGG